MKQGYKPVSALLAIGGGYQALKTNYKTCLSIAVFTMLLPQLACEILFSFKADTLVKNLRSLSVSMSDGASFRVFLDESMGFFYSYLLLLILIWFLFVSGYFALIEIFRLENQESGDVSQMNFPKPSVLDVILRGMKSSLPNGLVFSILLGGISTVGQSIFPLLIFAAILALMGPVLMRFDGLGPFKAFWSAVFIKYPKPEAKEHVSRWSIFFAISGIAAFFYTALFIILYFSQVLLEFDQILPMSRLLWTGNIPGLPFSFAYEFADILISSLIVLLICFLPATTSQLYYQINFPEFRIDTRFSDSEKENDSDENDLSLK